MVQKLSGMPIVCCNRVYKRLRRELWRLENSLCPGQGEAYDAGGPRQKFRLYHDLAGTNQFPRFLPAGGTSCGISRRFWASASDEVSLLLFGSITGFGVLLCQLCPWSLRHGFFSFLNVARERSTIGGSGDSYHPRSSAFLLAYSRDQPEGPA